MLKVKADIYGEYRMERRLNSIVDELVRNPQSLSNALDLLCRKYYSRMFREEGKRVGWHNLSLSYWDWKERMAKRGNYFPPSNIGSFTGKLRNALSRNGPGKYSETKVDRIFPSITFAYGVDTTKVPEAYYFHTGNYKGSSGPRPLDQMDEIMQVGASQIIQNFILTKISKLGLIRKPRARRLL